MSEVEHPRHYNKQAGGVECIEIVRWLPFSLGNAIKYIWRYNEKGSPVQDLEKARWYVRDWWNHQAPTRPEDIVKAPFNRFVNTEDEPFKSGVIFALFTAGRLAALGASPVDQLETALGMIEGKIEQVRKYFAPG